MDQFAVTSVLNRCPDGVTFPNSEDSAHARSTVNVSIVLGLSGEICCVRRFTSETTILGIKCSIHPLTGKAIRCQTLILNAQPLKDALSLEDVLAPWHRHDPDLGVVTFDEMTRKLEQEARVAG